MLHRSPVNSSSRPGTEDASCASLNGVHRTESVTLSGPGGPNGNDDLFRVYDDPSAGVRDVSETLRSQSLDDAACTPQAVASDSSAIPDNISAAQQPYTPIFTRAMLLPLVLIALFDVSAVFLQVLYRLYLGTGLLVFLTNVIAPAPQSAASLDIPASVNSAMRATLLVITGILNRLLRVHDGLAGRIEWVGIGVSTIGAIVIAANQVRISSPRCMKSRPCSQAGSSLLPDLRGVTWRIARWTFGGLVCRTSFSGHLTLYSKVICGRFAKLTCVDRSTSYARSGAQYRLPRSRHSVRDQSVRNSAAISAPRECLGLFSTRRINMYRRLTSGP